MPQLLVSVIIPVFNCRDTVSEALDSVFSQTLPAERIETIVVDDGSTDGSAELLEEMARAHDRVTVLHQPNSGGAGAPRNRGLERASGKYVFFLDADDRLGPEALERMVAMAERNGTDIVLGKQVGVGGRKISRGLFDETIERTHVLDPGCDLFERMSMAALQLFRRSLIEKAGLRFTEGMPTHEDQLFTAGAYLAASGVSVLADYDCYYWAARTDGSSVTQIGGTAPADVYAVVARAMRQAAEYAEPGEVRARLHHRYLRMEVFTRLERLYLDSSPEDRKITLAGCRELLEEWCTPDLLERSHPVHRVLAHCVLNGLDDELVEVLRFRREGTRPRVLLEEGRAFLMFPFFRNAVTRIPDACFEALKPPAFQPRLTRLEWEADTLVIAGTVMVRDVYEGAPSARLILEDDEGAERRVQCETSPGPPDDKGLSASFTATLRPETALLPAGTWTVSIEIAFNGLVQKVPLVKPRGMTAPRAAFTSAGIVRPLPLPLRGGGNLVIDVGGALTPADFRNVEVVLGPKNRVRVRAEAPPILGRGPAMSVLLQHAADDTVIRAVLQVGSDDPSRCHADISLARARPGHWRARFAVDGAQDPVPVHLPEGSGILGPAMASLVPPRRLTVRLCQKTLTVQVTVPLVSRARRALRRLKRPSGRGATPS
ncbi:glycosyl transferase [Mycobacterium tuberculosis]|nr:glycosyl transferase [Mycobacterium tuberculosis]